MSDLTAERAPVLSCPVHVPGPWIETCPSCMIARAAHRLLVPTSVPSEALTAESEALLDALYRDGREEPVRWSGEPQDLEAALRRVESAARRAALTDSPSPDDAPSVVDQWMRGGPGGEGPLGY